LLPKELAINLLRVDKMLKLPEARIRPKFKEVTAHIYLHEQFTKLDRSRCSVSTASESWKA